MSPPSVSAFLADLVAEDHLGVVETMLDHPGPGVGGEQAGVEVDKAAQRGEAELAGLEDQVEAMDLVEEPELGGVGDKGDRAATLVGDGVEVRQAPAGRRTGPGQPGSRSSAA